MKFFIFCDNHKLQEQKREIDLYIHFHCQFSSQLYWNQMDQKNGQNNWQMAKDENRCIKHNYTTRFDVIFFCFRTLTSYLNKKERWLTYSFSMPIFFSIFGIKWTKKMAKKIVKWQRWKPINISALPGGNTWKILAFQNQSLTLVLILSKLQFDHNFVKCHKFGLNFIQNFTGELFFYF